MTTCPDCGLTYSYPPKFHRCKTQPDRPYKPNNWLDDIERLQGVKFKENR